MITNLAISGYRSLRDIGLRLGRVNVITGPNGSGKSNIYRALRLLAETAQGGLHACLAREGGFPSTLWAGPENFSRAMKRGEERIEPTVRNARVALKLGFSGPDYSYAIDLGLPQTGSSLFSQDPQIKREVLWTGEILRPATIIADRRGPAVTVKDDDGVRHTVQSNLAAFDSMMTHAADPRAAPEILILRETMRNWRFYDHFRTDMDAPARRPQIATYTPVLSEDGSDLAAALQTIREIGNDAALDAAIEDAFPGTRVEISAEDGYFEAHLLQHGLLRRLRTMELSDGTLRYILLVAALLSPRPPAVLVLNEPETSLHPDLLAPLGRLIATASRESQVIVVTHARDLIEALQGEVAFDPIELRKDLGETEIPEDMQIRWVWPKR